MLTLPPWVFRGYVRVKRPPADHVDMHVAVRLHLDVHTGCENPASYPGVSSERQLEVISLTRSACSLPHLVQLCGEHGRPCEDWGLDFCDDVQEAWSAQKARDDGCKCQIMQVCALGSRVGFDEQC